MLVVVYTESETKGTWSYELGDGMWKGKNIDVNCNTETKVFLYDKIRIKTENYKESWSADDVDVKNELVNVTEGTIQQFGTIIARINGKNVQVPYNVNADIIWLDHVNATLTEKGVEDWSNDICRTSIDFLRNHPEFLDERKVREHSCTVDMFDCKITRSTERILTLSVSYSQSQRITLN